MATQFDPIAKDESLNTTESPSRNVADVLAQGLDAIEQAIAGGSGSGGHTIVNASGTDMTQRAKMQFVDAGVTDDSANDKTKVEIVQTISAESDLTSAPDGVYQGTWDESVSDVLTADMVGYGSGTVEDALDAFAPKAISVSDFMTLESGVTFSGIIYEFAGMIALAGCFEKSGFTGINVKVATINSEYRTATRFQFSCTGYQSSHVYAASGTLQSGGNLYLSCDNSVGEISLDFTYKKG